MLFSHGIIPRENRWGFLLTILWFVLPLAAVSLKLNLGPSHYNNYLIYKHVFRHLVDQQNLYAFYPGEHLYQNHYGPTFGLLIAPFAMLPDPVGGALWVLASALMLFWALRSLPFNHQERVVLMSIVLIEMTGSLQNLQFNSMLCAWVIFTWSFLRQGRIWPAAFLSGAGLLVKLYGILGLLFTPFSGKYLRMAVAMIVAVVFLFALPMALAGPDFVVQSYFDWFDRLVGKNAENIQTNLTDGMQDLSAMGMFRRITGIHQISNLWFLVPAGLLMLLPLSRRHLLQDQRFQLNYLAQVLIGMVIFSTSAESPTYVIAVTGLGIWFVGKLPSPGKLAWFLLVLVILLTILSPTDIFPRALKKTFVNRFGLKALPCVAAWFVITWELLSGVYPKTQLVHARTDPAAST
jgi:hypothetical protein